MLLSRCMGLMRKRCSTLNFTFFLISAPAGTQSLSWATSMLPLALIAGYELCVGPHGSGTKNTNSSILLNFAKIQKVKNCRFKDQSCTAGLGIAMPEGYLRRSITSSLVHIGGSSSTAGFSGLLSFLQLTTGLLL